MWPGIIKLGRIEITVFGLVMALMFWVVSFWLWRKMRSDYAEDKIFSLCLVLALSCLVGSYSVFWLEHRSWGLSFPGSATGLIVGLLLWSRKHAWNFWEWADEVAVIAVLVMAIGSLAWGPRGVISAILLGFVWLAVSLLAKNYRRISLYTSGKVGLVASVSLLGLSLTQLVVAFSLWHKLYFTGLGIVSVVTIYVRSGRRLGADANLIWQKLRKR